MTKARYYIRVRSEDNDAFQHYLERNSIDGKFISLDLRDGCASMLYSLYLTDEDAGSIRLSFSLTGFLNFNRALNRQIVRRNAKIPVTNLE